MAQLVLQNSQLDSPVQCNDVGSCAGQVNELHLFSAQRQICEGRIFAARISGVCQGSMEQ